MLEVIKGGYITPEGGFLYKDLYVVSDLHIGIEESFLSLVRMQTQEMLERLRKAKDKYGFKTLVLNGDIKHSYGKEISQEWEEIRIFDKALEEMGLNRVYIKGNHDKYLENILRAETVKEFVYKGIYISHGDKDFELSYTLHVIGNEHPSIRIRDELKKVWSMPAFAYFENERVLVTPAFNPLSRGEDVLNWEYGSFISPVLKKVEIPSGKVFGILDWEEILAFGKIKDLREVLKEY